MQMAVLKSVRLSNEGLHALVRWRRSAEAAAKEEGTRRD